MTKLDNRFWNRYFKVYDLLGRLIPYQDLLEKIIEELEVKDGDKILDVGSGTGNLALLLAAKGAQVIGIDSSEEAIKIHKSKQPNAILYLADISKKLPFEDETFDKICSNNVIYTIENKDRSELFTEFNRILRRDGIIVVSNLVEGFSPSSIYCDSFRSSKRRNGTLKTMLDVLKFGIPTLRIFYYNYVIKKVSTFGSGSLMNENEQKELLNQTGFKKISDNIRSYSGQAILNKARK